MDQTGCYTIKLPKFITCSIVRHEEYSAVHTYKTFWGAAVDSLADLFDSHCAGISAVRFPELRAVLEVGAREEEVAAGVKRTVEQVDRQHLARGHEVARHAHEQVRHCRLPRERPAPCRASAEMGTTASRVG